MKRTKVYRPRRGLRFTDDVAPAQVKGGFVGAHPLQHPHRTVPKTSIPPAKVETVDTSGEVERSSGRLSQALSLLNAPFPPTPTGLLSPVILTSSLIIRDSISNGRAFEKIVHREVLLGITPSGLGPPGNLDTGAITGSSIPSWTNARLGPNRNAAYVAVSLSSSNHESQVLNCFLSGTEPLESSPVPVSRSLYYSKLSQLNTIIVKLTSSQPTGLIDDANFGTLVSPSSSVGQPLKFNFNVPVTGKLTDIKVWVEMVTLSGNNSVGSTGSAGHLVWAGVANPTIFPLESFGISLRSPNVSWPGHWAHPIMNDPAYLSHRTATASQNALDNGLGYRNPPEFYRDSYLLWEPASIFNLTHPDTLRPYIPTWGHDLGMRTVFYDGSGYSNPRSMAVNSPVDLNANGAPCVTGSWPFLTPGTYQEGNNVPWTTDSGTWGNNSPSLSSYGTQAGSPPKGWLTGPANTANANEWPTTGSNLGAPNLQPVYPFLDDLYQRLYGDAPPSPSPSWYAGGQGGLPVNFLYPDYPSWTGFRPGLRDTEISGTWTLMFCVPSVAFYSGSASWTFVRQARLEITYSQNRSSSGIQRRLRRGTRPWAGGPRFISLLSGSSHYVLGIIDVPGGQDSFIHATYALPQPTTPGTSWGLFLGTGSAPDGTALQWDLSGGILAQMFGTGPGWLTNNQYGMPAIPLSSWSLGFPITPVPVSSSNPLPVVFPNRTLGGPQRLVDVAATVNPPQSLVQLAHGLSTGSL